MVRTWLSGMGQNTWRRGLGSPAGTAASSGSTLLVCTWQPRLHPSAHSLLAVQRLRQASGELRSVLAQHGPALQYRPGRPEPAVLPRGMGGAGAPLERAGGLLKSGSSSSSRPAACMRRGVAGTTGRHSAFLLAIHGGQHARVAQLATLAAAPTHMQGLGSYAAFRTRAEPERPQLFSAAQLAELTANPAVVHFTGPPTVAPCAFLNPHVSGWSSNAACGADACSSCAHSCDPGCLIVGAGLLLQHSSPTASFPHTCRS